MTVKVLGLCRGNGKGYIEITTDLDPEGLMTRVRTATGVHMECPIYRIGFPAEDEIARRHAGDDPEPGMHLGVIAVPLLDETSLEIGVFSREDPTHPLLVIPFKTFETKIKSRLAYKYHKDLTGRIRDIDQRRLSGRPYTYITGIYPVEDHTLSCRFRVRFPYDGSPEGCAITVLDKAGNRMDVTPVAMEAGAITDPRDDTQRINETEYSIILEHKPQTLCIYAKPERHDGNFTCISEPMFEGFVNGAYDLTKKPWWDEGYGVWFEQHRATWADVANQRAISAKWEDRPLISIVTAVFRPPVEYLKAYIDSVLAQSYEHFELILVNVSGDSPETSAVLDAIDDPRVRIITTENKSIPENTNVGIAVSKGDYIAFVDHDDTIEPDTLYRYMCEIREHPDADLLYCDEDLLDNGVYRWPVFKPQFNPDMLYGSNYVTHMLMVSRHVLSQVELSGADVSGAQDFDLTLKCAEKARCVRGVQYMLYHWRAHQNSTSANMDSKPYAEEAGRLSIQRHFERVGINAEVSESELPCRFRTRYFFSEDREDHTNDPKVSIVIPTKDHASMLKTCIDSVLSKTTYANFDVTVVENNSVEPETFAYYEEVQKQDPRVKVVTWPGKGFNYSAICNYGAAQSSGDLLLFLNNDTEVIDGGWLESMVGFFARPEVGMVGAKLIFRDKLVQHGGIWVTQDHCGHYGEMMSYKDGGYLETLRYPVNVAAVTGACQMVRRSVFSKVGGLDEDLAVVLNDVDLSLKVGQEGYLIVFDPQAMLYHAEHVSRGRDETDKDRVIRAINERARFYAKWDQHIVRGQYLNRNLDQGNGHYKITW
ncbi:glycosyltransferase family 2 protein [Bifidobacterium vespertilionis]|uniref:glycosyltransferase family 2 protein n=1 Tax=Bifidobacterium vespertilionis TaxID=2562524 RepID=UPI001BDD4B00|nr:glycosyltransferase family 2 protein [Bifidobacterium vespertilionis]MBT1180215.1 glycosyltransferase family 2 protein [Bifidobacterium vespertilionis]